MSLHAVTLKLKALTTFDEVLNHDTFFNHGTFIEYTQYIDYTVYPGNYKRLRDHTDACAFCSPFTTSCVCLHYN